MHLELGLELGHRHGRVQREVDVVTEEEVARLGAVTETGEPVAAGLRGFEQLPVVIELERARHAATSTSSRAAAASARRTASSGIVRDRDDVAAAIAIPAHRADRLADLQVRLGLDDPVRGEDRPEIADPHDATGGQRAGRGRQEPDRERLRELRERELVGNVFAESLANRDLDHVDADRMAHEVGHLTAGDPGGDLDDGDPPIGCGDELGKRDPVPQAESPDRLDGDLSRAPQLVAVRGRWIDVHPPDPESDARRPQAIRERQERRLTASGDDDPVHLDAVDELLQDRDAGGRLVEGIGEGSSRSSRLAIRNTAR